MRGYVAEGVADKVRAAGGEIYAISSEPQVLSDRAKSEWKLDFETVGDPHQEIADACRERGWLDLYVNERLEFLQQSAGDGLDWEPTHPKGFFQPGVLSLRANGQVLYRWRGVPTHKNMGGATERPTAGHVWTQVESAVAAEGGAPDAPLDDDPTLDSRGIPWPIFASLLIANGWFLSARGFKSVNHVMMAALRIVGFIALWIAAFAWMPTAVVLIALAGWVAFIIPKLRWVSREFQDVSATPP